MGAMSVSVRSRAAAEVKPDPDAGVYGRVIEKKTGHPSLRPKDVRATRAKTRVRSWKSRPAEPLPTADDASKHLALLVRAAKRQEHVSLIRPSSLDLAVEGLLRIASCSPAPGERAHVASLLRQAVAREANARPRHAAVALALHDAVLQAAAEPTTAGSPAPLRDGARVLLSPFISDEDERSLLDALNRSWDRVPALDEGPLADLLK